MTLTFLRQRGAAAFVADNVARYLAREGLAKALPIDVPIELPPVGLLTLRNRRATPAAEQFMACCREVAAAQPPRAASRKLSRASS